MSLVVGAGGRFLCLHRLVFLSVDLKVFGRLYSLGPESDFICLACWSVGPTSGWSGDLVGLVGLLDCMVR